MAHPKLSRVTTVELRRELDRRASRLGEMESRRTELETELTRINAEIRALSGTGLTIHATRNRRQSRITKRHGTASNAAQTRSENTVTLTEALLNALNGKTLGVGEVADAVLNAGYKTRARNFRTVVNLTLLKRKDLFVKKGRGQYTAK